MPKIEEEKNKSEIVGRAGAV